MKKGKTIMRPINGMVLLELPPLREKNDKGIMLTQAQQFEDAVNPLFPFKVHAADEALGLLPGQMVYMNPQEFKNPVIVEYKEAGKLIAVSGYSILGLATEKTPSPGIGLGNGFSKPALA